MRRIAARLAAAVLALAPAGALAQDITGLWKCEMNSRSVSIDLMVQIAGDFTLFGRGTLIYPGTSGYYQIEAPGRWAIGIAEEHPGEPTVALQFLPGNHASFTLFTRFTSDPGALYARDPNLAVGGETETACQRWG